MQSLFEQCRISLYVLSFFVQSLLHRTLSYVQSLFAQSLSHNVVAISGSSGSIVAGAGGSLCCIARRRAALMENVPRRRAA